MAERQAKLWVDGIFYSPTDYAWCVRRVLRLLRPAVLVVLETEIWPHLFAETKRTGAQLILANARISDRTWPRYEQFRWFFSPVLALADLVFAQSNLDAERYQILGVDPAHVLNNGNLKYDAVPEPSARLPLSLGDAEQVWIAASTVGANERGSAHKHSVDEDDIVLDVFIELAQEIPRLLLILAPRQPQRFDAVAEKLAQRKIPYVRRTEMEQNGATMPRAPAVLLLDTVGELARCYALANVVFVGGSLAPRGGHNILEPAAVGAAILVGPNMQNFRAIAADFAAASALVEVPDAEALRKAVRHLLKNPAEARALGERARTVVERRRGLATQLAQEIGARRPQVFLREPRNWLQRSILDALARLWIAGGERKRRRGEACAQRRGRLPLPVISVGGITLGGSGKTPFCNHLASELRRRGYHPAILTRGYHRRSPAKFVLLPPGANALPSLTGDEAQIFLRSGHASVAIGADRYEAGRALLQHAPGVGVFLLDDGFQHARLPRDVDIVLIDGLDPFGGSAVVPQGRLREPLTALQRAHLFVVTRAPDRARFDAIRDSLQQWNCNAPVFAARLEAHRWRWWSGGSSSGFPAGTRVAAFCGLGNPANFWKTLESFGLNVELRWAFSDHHLYKPVELKRLVDLARARDIDLLVTTEKDSVNLPQDLASLLGDIRLAWLPIELILDDPENFFAHLDELVERAQATPIGL